ncbi:MAG: pyrimidine 5'-nucleotidase [Pseudomonadota bacterium]
MLYDFDHITTWVFDLDHTLYPPQTRLFDQIEARMVAYVMRALGVDKAEADKLRAAYWRAHGTTLAGLMHHHEIDAVDFINDVHDIDFSVLSADPDLRAHIQNLPGRRIVYTNGGADYAARVLDARGLTHLFDAIYGVEHADWRPKPEHAAFERVFARDGLDPTRGAMFEDEPRNLEVPHLLGMRTVHVAPQPHTAPHIHHHTHDLSGFLAQLVP